VIKPHKCLCIYKPFYPGDYLWYSCWNSSAAFSMTLRNYHYSMRFRYLSPVPLLGNMTWLSQLPHRIKSHD